MHVCMCIRHEMFEESPFPADFYIRISAKQYFRPCPAVTYLYSNFKPPVRPYSASFAFCGGQVHQWARTSPEIHAVMATDLILYDFAVAFFKQQTAESLGTHWEA